MKIDCHVHALERSGCSIASEVELIRAGIGVGLDALVFTDHHQLVPERRLVQLNEMFAPFRVFGGIEITTTDMEDILVLGVQDSMLESRYWRYADLHTFVRERNGYLVLAHPFRHHKKINIDMEKYPVDSIEARSNNIVESHYGLIKETMDTWACNQIWNSDAHSSDVVGIFHNCLARPARDERDLVAILRAGDYSCKRLEGDASEFGDAGR